MATEGWAASAGARCAFLKVGSLAHLAVDTSRTAWEYFISNGVLTIRMHRSLRGALQHLHREGICAVGEGNRALMRRQSSLAFDAQPTRTPGFGVCLPRW